MYVSPPFSFPFRSLTFFFSTPTLSSPTPFKKRTKRNPLEYSRLFLFFYYHSLFHTNLLINSPHSFSQQRGGMFKIGSPDSPPGTRQLSPLFFFLILFLILFLFRSRALFKQLCHRQSPHRTCCCSRRRYGFFFFPKKLSFFFFFFDVLFYFYFLFIHPQQSTAQPCIVCKAVYRWAALPTPWPMIPTTGRSKKCLILWKCLYVWCCVVWKCVCTLGERINYIGKKIPPNCSLSLAL